MNQSKIEIIKFTVKNEKFALKITNVSEIFRVNEIRKYPMSNDNVVGLTDIRNNVVTLIDSSIILFDNEDGWTKNECSNKFILLLDNIDTNKNIGLIIDDVDEVTKIKSDNIKTNTVDEGDIISGIIKTESDLIPLIDENKLENKF